MAKHTERKERRRAEREARRGQEFRAAHRFARMSASKVRLVADQVRGLPVSKALEALQFSKKRGGALLLKVVKSALANAEYQISEQKLDLDVDDLVLSDVRADQGPMLKRWMTRARGMAYPILRKYCHISVKLEPRGGRGGGGKEGGEARAAGAEGSEKAGAAEKRAEKQALAGAS